MVPTRVSVEQGAHAVSTYSSRFRRIRRPTGDARPARYHRRVAASDVRARAVQADGRWSGRILPDGRELTAPTRERILSLLRDEAREGVLTVELEPALVGVAEAAAILRWDKRRVATYVERGSFPVPVASLASGRVWRREDIEAFGRAFERRRATRARRRARA
jgi:hypothetical protein